MTFTLIIFKNTKLKWHSIRSRHHVQPNLLEHLICDVLNSHSSRPALSFESWVISWIYLTADCAMKRLKHEDHSNSSQAKTTSPLSNENGMPLSLGEKAKTSSSDQNHSDAWLHGWRPSVLGTRRQYSTCLVPGSAALFTTLSKDRLSTAESKS